MVNAASPSANRLARYLYGEASGHQTDELAVWIASSPRLRGFADAHRDKIRKKLRGAVDDEARRDVRAELEVAHRLLLDRRIDVTFEPGGATRGGPDFAVTFRGHAAFNLEVTRPRRGLDATTVGRIVLAKLRQLPASSPNALILALDAPPGGSPLVATAVRELRSLADARDAGFLERAGIASARDFYQRYLRLGAVLMWCPRASGDGAASAWINRSARIAVPERALRACLAALRAR